MSIYFFNHSKYKIRDFFQQSVYRFALAVTMFDQISSNLVQPFLGQINLLAKRIQKYPPSLPLTTVGGVSKVFRFLGLKK